MVTTRGKRAVAVDEPSKPRKAQRSTAPRTLGQEVPSNGNEHTSDHSASETVGSRLRKRRRTDSAIADDQSSLPKRQNRRRTAPTDFQREAEASSMQEDPPTPSEDPYHTSIDPQPTDGETRSPAVRHSQELGVMSAEGSTGSGGSAVVTEGNPDLATVISNIINHGETIDNHYAAHGLNELGIVDTESFLPLSASMHLKIQSLPILDNLATQLLNTLAKSTIQEMLAIATDPDSEAGQAYNTLKSLFDHTKKVYSIHEPFLIPDDLGLSDSGHGDIIRKANLATFISSVFGSQDVGFYHLNEFFLDTFVGDSNRIMKSQAQLFLDLKTQAFISAQAYGQQQREELLEDLFPTDLEKRLLERRVGIASTGSQLEPSETDFLQWASHRRKALLEEANSNQSMALLTQKYVWEDFLNDISAYVSGNFESLVGVSMDTNSGPSRMSRLYQTRTQDGAVNGLDQQRQDAGAERVSSHPNADAEVRAAVAKAQDDVVPRAIAAADAATQGFGFHQAISLPLQQSLPIERHNGAEGGARPRQMPNGRHTAPNEYGPPPCVQNHLEHASSLPFHPPQPPPHVFFNQSHFPHGQGLQPHFNQTPVDMNIQQQFYGDQPAIPFPTQSAPTQVLYERARMAATAKASPSNRRAGTPSQRRPWSTEEENALMAGLDRVKGPHWSQILAMFGAGGTINETLKDRNQVQLKDKARNLKLFFLKSGIEVPYYLQCVTGELKTRAPGQAAKYEAKEKERDMEERAHVEGVMTLAGVHEASRADGDDQEAGLDDEDGNYYGESGINPKGVQTKTASFAGQQQGYQPAYAPEASMLPTYNNEVTPAFQAMIDAAAAEAARVGASAD